MIITKKVIEKLKKRDEATFNKIYQEYEGLIYYVCYSITLNKEVSEELMQDTFVKLLTSLDNYSEDGHFKQYIMQIARNLSKNYVMRIKNKEIYLEDEVYQNYADNDSQEAKMIIELEGLLNPLEADIVIKKVVYNFKFKEIAEDNKLTIGETQAIYYRAIEKVKKAYIEAEKV